MDTIGIIPARYDSTRFLGKPLVDIAGMTMIRRVYEQVKLANLSRVVVATDDERIAEHVRTFGEVVMTRADHRTGTDRCAEVVQLLGLSGIVVNIQGDEPLVSPQLIAAVANYLIRYKSISIVTAVKSGITKEELENVNTVKAYVSDTTNLAADFSRGDLFSGRNIKAGNYTRFKHIGMYGFRAAILPTLSALPSSEFELKLSLEQLRWLENGYKIGVVETDEESIGVDTPEDVEKVIKLLFNR